MRLRHGVNRFYVMASRPGSVDVEGRSETVEVRYDGPDRTGRLHVLALGVSKYQDPNRALRFAEHDAQKLANFLHRSRLADTGVPGLEIVLANQDVNQERGRRRVPPHPRRRQGASRKIPWWSFWPATPTP